LFPTRPAFQSAGESSTNYSRYAFLCIAGYSIRTTYIDAQLQALQSLSAQLKLLLDCPEHLWRLLEHKRHLHAAWLFLLARVVHRSLTGSEDEEQAGWSGQGINVVEQFPLVQRQWDTISPFRTQITHKATLSLRDHTVVAEVSL